MSDSSDVDQSLVLIEDGARVRVDPPTGYVHWQSYCTDRGIRATWYPTRELALAAMRESTQRDASLADYVDMTPPGVMSTSWEAVEPVGTDPTR